MFARFFRVRRRPPSSGAGLRALRAALFSACAGLLLWGCPGYGDSDETQCVRDSQCAPSYVCSEAGSCVLDPIVRCEEPRDCAPTETCSAEGVCKVGDCSWDDIGCVEGFECTADEGLWECRPGSAGAGGASSGGADSGGANSGGSADSGGADSGGANSGGSAGTPAVPDDGGGAAGSAAAGAPTT
jgi:hypothetical protein